MGIGSIAMSVDWLYLVPVPRPLLSSDA